MYAIIGVSLVLFLFGLVGWIFLNLQKTGNYFKENIQFHAYIYRTATDEQIDSLKAYIIAIPYAVNVEYITREMAIEKYNSEMSDRPLHWDSAKVNKVECDQADNCDVYVIVGYSIPLPGSGGANAQSFSPLKETWLRLRDQWYYLPGKEGVSLKKAK